MLEAVYLGVYDRATVRHHDHGQAAARRRDGAGCCCRVSLTCIEVWFDISEPARGESTMPTRGPTTRRPDPTLWDELQGEAIDAPEGKELMPVTADASVPHELATR